MAVVTCLGSFSYGQGLQSAQAKFDAGQYTDALKLISPALTQAKADDNPDEQYKLLMLRGECLLRVKNRTGAADNFDLAMKYAPNVKDAAVARATAVVVRASPANKYTPKGKDKTPIDILDAESRKSAMEALRTDMVKNVKPRYDQAMSAQTLTPMMKLLPTLIDIGYLEAAGGGSATETRQDIQAMGTRARELINNELRRLNRQLNAIEIASNTTTDFARRGLYADERATIATGIDYVKQIEQTARDVRRRGAELGFDTKVWEPIIADAADLADRGQALLNIPDETPGQTQ